MITGVGSAQRWKTKVVRRMRRNRGVIRERRSKVWRQRRILRARSGARVRATKHVGQGQVARISGPSRRNAPTAVRSRARTAPVESLVPTRFQIQPVFAETQIQDRRSHSMPRVAHSAVDLIENLGGQGRQNACSARVRATVARRAPDRRLTTYGGARRGRRVFLHGRLERVRLRRLTPHPVFWVSKAIAFGSARHGRACDSFGRDKQRNDIRNTHGW